MGANTVAVTDDNFEAEVLKSAVPVLVDFWAPWCGPCRSIAPALEQLAEEYVGKIKVAKYNVDDHTRFAAEYGVRSIPAIFLFKNGAVADSLVGAAPKSSIAGKIDAVLAG